MKILRHNKIIRFSHWLTALAVFLLFFSGFGQMPIYQRYFIDQIPGLAWSSNFFITLHLHYIGAIILIFISFYYLSYVLYQKKWDLMPKKGDFKESIQIVLASFGLGQEEPQEKYLAEQRLAFLATAISIFALIISGVFKVYKNIYPYNLSASASFWVAQVHNLFTVLLLLLVIFHLAAFLIKTNRPLFFSMFTGKIDLDYVKKRHGKWYEQLEKEKIIKQIS